jgi:DNA-directed RNA polymerase specialized sigma24 family protein
VGQHQQKMSPEDSRTLRQMSDEDLNVLILRLGRHALRRNGARSHSSHETVEGVVCEAFGLWLDGTRRWNRDRYPDLESFLCGIVDSVMSHSRTSSYSQHTQLIGTERELEAHQSAGGSLSPEESLLSREKQQQAEDLLDAASKNDPLAIETIRWMRAGSDNPQDIAQKIGCPVEDVYLAIRRIKARGVNARRELEARNSNIRGAKTYGDEAAK